MLTATPPLPTPFADWFAHRGWTPRSHQLAMLEQARLGHSALLIAPTGGSKTLAVALGRDRVPAVDWGVAAQRLEVKRLL